MPHSSLFSSSLFSMLSSLLALAAVLGMIVAAAKLVKFSGIAPQTRGRLSLQASLPIDPRRRLSLVRADGREFLLLTGGATDLLIGEITEPKS